MKPNPATITQIRIGSFRLDLRSGELYTNGIKTKLQEQPLQVLETLLERPGEVVTREELRHKLWPADTFVDFEHGLNRAINKLRQALGDNADEPRYIETVPRRGYRLIARVETLMPASTPASLESSSQSPVAEKPPAEQAEAPPGIRVQLPGGPQAAGTALRFKLVLGVFGLMVIGGSLLWFGKHRVVAPPELRQRRLTANPVEYSVSGAAISPDGRYLAYSDPTGIYVKLVETGETHKITAQPDSRSSGGHMERNGPRDLVWEVAGWFPDGSTLLANLGEAKGWSVWRLSILGGVPRKLREGVWAFSVSPDGSLVAFTTGEAGTLPLSELWLMGPGGEDARRIATSEPGSHFGVAVWAPDGRRIATRSFSGRCAIETRDLTGGPITVVSDPDLCRGYESLWWLSDGRLIYSQPEQPPNQHDDNLWQVRVDPRTGAPAGKPQRITNWVDSHFWGLSATADGKRLAFLRGNPQSDVYVGELEAKGMRLKTPQRLTMDQHQDFPGAWAQDSKTVFFDSDRTGSFNIFKQTLDQDSAEPLTMGAEPKSTPRLTPDGSWILYSVTAPGKKYSPSAPQRLMRMPVGGGPSQLVLEAHNIDDYHCARMPATLCVLGERSADGNELLLTTFDPVKGREHEVGKIKTRMGPGTVSWDLSPDASRIAFTEFDEREGHIHFLSLRGGIIPDLVVRGWHGFMLMALTAPKAVLVWAPDGNGLFVTSFSPISTTILYTDLQGHAYPLWEQEGSFASWCVPSPDGRHLAITKTDWDSNAWMLENF